MWEGEEVEETGRGGGKLEGMWEGCLLYKTDAADEVDVV